MADLQPEPKPQLMKPDSGLRIVLLGKSEDKKTKLGDFIITGKSEDKNPPLGFIKGKHSTKKLYCLDGEWNGKTVRVVKTTDIFSQSAESVRQEMEMCVSLCSPGPNVILLLLKSSEFKEEDRRTLKFIMQLFHQNAFNHSMVVMTHNEREANSRLQDMITADCEGRLYRMTEDDHKYLMEKIEKIVDDNRGICLAIPLNRPLNLVLCGRRGAEKTSAANAILGQTKDPGSGPSTECVKRQEKVCGRWVNLVELPALCETSMDTFMYNVWRCVSLCDPEGVHAFLLAVPLGPLTDKDKRELQSLQDVVSSEVDDFIMVLHTVEDSTQVPELLDAAEKIRSKEGKPLCFTKDMFVKAQIKLITELQKLGNPSTGDYDNQSRDCLRMVLVGKTGSGKSASGNTILGQDRFPSKSSQKSITKRCEREHGEKDGSHVLVVDTPGLFDTSLSQDEVNQEMTKCISLLAPGPHVFLLAVPLNRLTDEDQKSLKLIQEAFGKNSKKFAIILFTGGDNLKYEKRSIADYIEDECDDPFKKLIDDCGGRYHVFDNRDETNRKQVSDLLMKVEKMVKENGGGCYTAQMFQEAEEAIKKQMEKILKDKEAEMKKAMEDLRKQFQEEIEAMKTRMEDQSNEFENERKKRVQELEEKEDSFKKEQKEREQERKKIEDDDKIKEEIERKKWEEKIETLEREKIAGTVEKEQMKKAQEDWENERKDMKRRQEEKERENEVKEKSRLQAELEKEKETIENLKRKEDQRRQQQQKELQKKLLEQEKKLEELGKKYEDEARQKAVNEGEANFRWKVSDKCIIL